MFLTCLDIFFVYQEYIRDISGVYWGPIVPFRGPYPPLSLYPQKGGPMVRERGIPERINRNSLAAMMGPGPLGNAIVLLLCCVASAACRAVIVRWDLMNGTWEEKRGGVDARAAGLKAFPQQTAEGCLFPPGLLDAFEFASVSSHSAQKNIGSLKDFLDVRQGPL